MRLFVVLAVLALSGCGADEPADAPVRERTAPPAGTPTPGATEAEPGPSPTATATPTATAAPEEQEGGAGDEAAPEQSARFVIGRDGKPSPTSVQVTAFLPVRLTFHNESTQELQLNLGQLGQGNVFLGPGESRDVALAGPKPGTYELLLGEQLVKLTAVAGGSP